MSMYRGLSTFISDIRNCECAVLRGLRNGAPLSRTPRSDLGAAPPSGSGLLARALGALQTRVAGCGAR